MAESKEVKKKKVPVTTPDGKVVDKVKKTRKTKKVEVSTPVNVANQPPAGATQADIDPVVVSGPEQTFEERTSGLNQPWLNEDGSQNVG